MPVVLSATLAEIEEAAAHNGGKQIKQEGLVGEETLTGFDCSVWLAVRVGDVLEGRYKVLGKVANGGSSTIWFVQDQETQDHWILKICIKYTSGDAREERAFKVIGGRATTTTTHRGLRCLQRPQSQFNIDSARSGRHQCFLLDPSACDVEKAWREVGDLSLSLAKEILENVLLALDFLHTECKLVHTDLKLDNILFCFAHEKAISAHLNKLAAAPKESKIHYGKDGDEYPVTAEVPIDIKKGTFAVPLLNDFGEAVEMPEDGGYHAPHLCSPQAYRAPETILKRRFNTSIDVWMIGCNTLQLLSGSVPFKPPGKNKHWTDAYTLAQHHAVLGAPPRSWIAQCANAREYWDEEGQWIHPDHAIPDKSLEKMLSKVKGKEQRKLALNFVRSCLQWEPEDRLSAGELVKHPFLQKSKASLVWEKVKKAVKKEKSRILAVLEKMN